MQTIERGFRGAWWTVVALSIAACSSETGDEQGGSAGAPSTGGGQDGGANAGGSSDGAGTNAGAGDSGGDTSAGGAIGVGGSGGGEPITIPFACPGGRIAPGMNQVQVGDLTRSFYVDFPSDPSQPMGVVFSWHGFGDTLENHRAASALDPNGDPALPLAVITPDDSGLQPPMGLDWDIAKGTPADTNRDLAFFEAMLGCMNAQYSIDPTRIYSYGFSAGSVMTSLLHSRYPGLLSAIVAISGAWFNDPAEQDLVNFIDIAWSWPELDPADGGTVLLTHGGPNDQTVLGIMNLEDAAQAAFPFLKAANRIVVDCPHENGHSPHPEMTPAMVSAFFSAHRAGQPSPYESGTIQGFPASCQLRLP
ncbi:MAG: hypothetical protein HOW73_51390 [Polyangiaceae bacterium]|nr:hypothetical protein [Polyangiaceae bacterium]